MPAPTPQPRQTRAYAAVLLMLTFGGIVIEDRYKQIFTCQCRSNRLRRNSEASVKEMVRTAQKTCWGTGRAATPAHIFLNSLAISPARQPRNCTLLPGRIWLACNLHRSVASIR